MFNHSSKSKKSVALFCAIMLILSLVCTLGGCKKAKDEPVTTTTEAQSSNQDAVAVDNTVQNTDNQQTVAPSSTKKAVTTTKKETTKKQQSSSVAEVTGTATVESANKTVVYPKALENSSKRYPVIVWANGTGCATSTYMSLLEKFAEAGYIVVADSSVMTADGTAQINSIDYIIGENATSNSVFHNKVDTSKIGASGHSQGGRSSVNAAQADSRIKCIVSIAGASSKEEATGLSAPALYLTGTSDMIVVSSQWVKPSYDASAGRAVYASLKGGVHTTCMTNPEKVSGYAISWFDAYLKGDSNAKDIFASGGKLATDSDWQDFQSKN